MSGSVAEVMPNQQPKAARQNVDSDQRLPSAFAAPTPAIHDRQEAGTQQHLGGYLLDVARERLADRVGEQVERGAGFPRPRLDDGFEPSYPGIVEGVDEPLGFRIDGLRRFPVHDRDDLPGDDGEDDAGADRAEEEDRQREAKSGSAKELTERRHESCNRRREPC